jgi:predicted RNase H-like HicB family nuclease
LEKGLVSEESMAVNFSMATLPQSATLKLHILLKRNDEGNAIASVLELPNCQVEALTHEQAIEDLKKLLQTRLEITEIIPLEIQLPQAKQTENPWMKFAGVFKDDPVFAEIAESIRAERNIMEDDLEGERLETDLEN